MIQLTTQIKIGDKAFTVSYPNVKQKLEIENMKMFLSSGKYGELARSGHKTASKLLDLIDAVSYFITLIPELKDQMSVDDFENMDLEVQRNWIRAHKIQFWPWIEGIDNEINKFEDDDEATPTDTNGSEEQKKNVAG